MPLEPGARLGQYQILAPLGSGGMGEVYRARDTRLGRDVAVKVLPEDVRAGSTKPSSRTAGVHVALGDAEAALDLLEEAGAQGLLWPCSVEFNPIYDSIRPDPRFVALLRRQGMAPELLEGHGEGDTARDR